MILILTHFVQEKVLGDQLAKKHSNSTLIHNITRTWNPSQVSIEKKLPLQMYLGYFV
jgi:hypothetical protein